MAVYMQIEIKIMVHASLVNADYFHDMGRMSSLVQEISGEFALPWAQVI